MRYFILDKHEAFTDDGLLEIKEEGLTEEAKKLALSAMKRTASNAIIL